MEEYLKTLSNATTRGMTASYLKKCAAYEEKYNTVLQDMTLDMLQDIFTNNFGDRISSANDAKTAVERYIRWVCNFTGTEYSGVISQINVDTIEKVKKSMVSSPYHLALLTDKLFNPLRNETQHNLYRAMLWLVYMGFTFNEATEITYDEVDLNDMVINHGDKSIEICREAFLPIKYVKNAKDFLVDQKRNSRKKRVDGDIFLSGIYKANMNLSVAGTAIKNLQEDTGTSITIRSIELSGIFHRAYQIERATGRIDFLEAVIMDGSLSYNPDNKSAFRRKVREVTRKYSEDYQVWKRAFC